MLRARALAVLPVAALIAAIALRAMVFGAPSDHPLRVFQPLFQRHPDALIDRGMREIGSSAARGAAMPASARQAMIDAMRSAPLAPEPFLVNGTVAQMAGDGRRAETLYVAARLRDPRAPGPRYFLAERYLRTNRIAAGLQEMAALATLSEQAARPLTPALAAYALTPGAIPQLKRFFRGAPLIRDMTLETLAQDPANARLVLDLAPRLPLRQSTPPGWQAVLLRSLVAAKRYDAAEEVWRRITGVGQRPLLYDPQFRDRSTAPPFNWQLTSGSAGVAEASATGGLDIVYYGREEAAFAAQLLRLRPGSYRLSMRIDAPSSARGLAWTVTCVGGTQKLLNVPLESARRGILAATFAIPTGNCPAQWIELRGVPGESSETAQGTVAGLRLERAAS